MIKPVKKIISTIILASFAALPLAGETCLMEYSNKTWGYRAGIPASWTKSETDFGYKHVIFFRSRNNIEFKITAQISTPEELAKWNGWKAWYMDSNQVNLMTIYESEDIEKDAVNASKVVVVECGRYGAKYIKKFSVRKRGDKLIIAEVSCPYRLYYQYTALIDSALSGIKTEEN